MQPCATLSCGAMLQIGTTDMFTKTPTGFRNISRAKGGTPLKPNSNQSPIPLGLVTDRNSAAVVGR